jgi:hypothetical protein
LNYVVWDIETDSAQTDWATIIEIGGILLDENLRKKSVFKQGVGCLKIEFQVLQRYASINQM